MFGLRQASRARTSIPLKSLRLARPISLWPTRHEEPTNIQRVRFQSPGFTWRRFGTLALYATCIGGYAMWIMPDVEIEVEVTGDEKGQEKDPEKGGQGEEGDEDQWVDRDSRFIPLTWAKKLPKSFYKGSDPEWQAFRDMAKDKDRQKRIQDELVGMVAKGIDAVPNLKRALGPDTKVGKFWLDIFFPDGPPQEYSRSGLEIGQDFVAISEQLVTQEQWSRTESILWPEATVNSFYSYCQTLWAFQRQKICAALGIDSKAEPGSPAHRANHLLQHIQAHQAAKDAKSKATTPPQASGRMGGDENTPGVETTLSPRHASAPGEAQNRWYMPTLRPGVPGGESLEHQTAKLMFAVNMHKGLNHSTKKPQDPPRGCFIVSGLVQLRGANAAITFDIRAFYDPRQRRYTHINVSPRNVKKWKQQPKGGP